MISWRNKEVRRRWIKTRNAAIAAEILPVTNAICAGRNPASMTMIMVAAETTACPNAPLVARPRPSVAARYLTN